MAHNTRTITKNIDWTSSSQIWSHKWPVWPSYGMSIVVISGKSYCGNVVSFIDRYNRTGYRNDLFFLSVISNKQTIYIRMIRQKIASPLSAKYTNVFDFDTDPTHCNGTGSCSKKSLTCQGISNLDIGEGKSKHDPVPVNRVICFLTVTTMSAMNHYSDICMYHFASIC